jgi:hypothetical protein
MMLLDASWCRQAAGLFASSTVNWRHLEDEAAASDMGDLEEVRSIIAEEGNTRKWESAIWRVGPLAGAMYAKAPRCTRSSSSYSHFLTSTTAFFCVFAFAIV